MTLDIGPLDVGVEDHATNAPFAVRRTAEALASLEDVLAVEVLTATAAIAMQDGGPRAMAPATTAILDVIAGTIRELGPQAPAGDVHAAVRDRLVDLVEVVDRAGLTDEVRIAT